MALNEQETLRVAEEQAVRAANGATLASWHHYMDVPLTITLELGRARLTAREILALEVDSIVKLSGSTGEGVDVWAGDRRLARGEVIMVEDRTGVRVNEVIAQEEA